MSQQIIEDMLKRENVQILEGVDSWEEAVRVAVAPLVRGPLVRGGYVEERYIDGIIENTHEMGPYYVLCPDFALLHARPEQGAIKQQLALTLLRKPVRFKPEGPDVRVLVTLAAVDADSHIDAIRRLAALFADPANITRLAESATVDEAYELFAGAPVLS